jgi:hypothetical protein
MGWDSRFRRVFITKKDYIPLSPCIEYVKDEGFFFNQSQCNATPPVATCPDGYTFNATTQMCERTVISAPLCPTGYTYDVNTQTCTLVETSLAECTCLADVVATPSSLTLSEGDTAIINLTSTVVGTTFSWTVIQSRVAGASGGSGTTISQALIGIGTATYTITPHYETCSGTPIQVVVTVGNFPSNPLSLGYQGYVASSETTTQFRPMTPQELKCYMENVYTVPPTLGNIIRGYPFLTYNVVVAIGDQLYDTDGSLANPSVANGTFFHRISTSVYNIYTVNAGIITGIISPASLANC